MPRPKLDDAEKLASLSVRTTQRQLARLQRAINTDGLPMQDHVRRALDEYLDAFEARFSLPMLPIGAVPVAPAPAPSPAPSLTPVPAPAPTTQIASPAPTLSNLGIDLPEIED